MERDVIWNKAYDIVKYSHFILNDNRISNKDKWEFVKKYANLIRMEYEDYLEEYYEEG